MTKLVPFSRKIKKSSSVSSLKEASVVVDEKGITQGFVFGRDTFISFLEYLDEEFEKRVPDPKKAFNNPAGKLIDTIESTLPINPDFVRELKQTVSKSKSTSWISLSEIKRLLNV